MVRLTPFGIACRDYRTQMRAVMNDQSAAIGFSAADISAIECGRIAAPEGYLKKVAEWMQLDEAETSELTSLLESKEMAKEKVETSLMELLNQSLIPKPSRHER